MSAIAALMMDDIRFDTVDFVPTYDEKGTEPVVLPGRFPNLLVNGSSGIAVGMATSIPPHNLGEICDAIVKVIDEPDVSIDELMEIVQGPDFPTGGVICGRAGIRRGYHTGTQHDCAARSGRHRGEERAESDRDHGNSLHAAARSCGGTDRGPGQ